MNNSMLTGFNGINTNIMQTGYGIQQAINADTVANMQNTNAIQSSLNNMSAQNASCCCEIQRQIERGFADTNYNMATQACETRQAIADSTRQVIDFLTQDKIATLTAETINHNVECFKKQMSRFIDFGEGKAIMVNNADWLMDLNYVDVLREVGAHFSVNRMLTAECYKQRMEKGLSFLEFNYMIMQSYDFYTLFQKYGCNMEFGGDDQWSNMLGRTEESQQVEMQVSTHCKHLTFVKVVKRQL